MTTKEAFARLISKRAWYKDLGISETTATNLAARFRKGEQLSTDKMEEVLVKAGYKVVQEKHWEHKDDRWVDIHNPACDAPSENIYSADLSQFRLTDERGEK